VPDFNLPGKTMEKIVSLEDIAVSYDERKTFVLENFDFEMFEGEHVVLSGKNGSGKTTLSKIAAGLMSPDFGRVELFENLCFDEAGVNAKSYEDARRNIAYVFQQPEISIVSQNVASNIAFAPQNLCFSVPEIDAAVSLELEKAGLETIAEKDPRELSGGEQQLVSIASAIAAYPKLLVLDEPTAYLDEANSKNCMRLIEKTKERAECAILHITHKEEEIKMADRVVSL
jgi:energy-coupling factor transporter ATP-binding protein EcfA2